MDENTAQSLLKAFLYAFQPEERPDWYAGVAELLDHDAASIRAATVERLTIAALWAEQFLPQRRHRLLVPSGRRRLWTTRTAAIPM